MLFEATAPSVACKKLKQPSGVSKAEQQVAGDQNPSSRLSLRSSSSPSGALGDAAPPAASGAAAGLDVRPTARDGGVSGRLSMSFRAALRALGFRVWGLGFRVWGLGFGVWGLGFRV